MKPLHRFTDIHSHRPDRATRGDTVVSIAPGDVMVPGGIYSVGIHPWETANRKIGFDELRQLVKVARDGRVVAIGECGFDRLRGGDLQCQGALFDFHARLARKLGKPLVIHSVRADDLLLAAARRHRMMPGEWIIHGFRGKPQAAVALLKAGFGLSIGKKYNPAVLELIPPHRLYHETDDMPS